TAPIAKSLASRISSNGISQFRAINIGASQSFVLSVLNASTHYEEKMNGASFLEVGHRLVSSHLLSIWSKWERQLWKEFPKTEKSSINTLVKEKQEKDKTKTKPDKNGKRGKAQQCQISVTVKKAGKTKKIQISGTKNENLKDPRWENDPGRLGAAPDLLIAPTEGYEDAIVVPAITADNFELNHGLLTLVQNKQFLGHDKEDPHAHVRYFNKITSTLKFSSVPNTSIKIMLFPFSLEGAARIWLEKEPPRSIFTWDDLVSKFINQFFPPSKTTNLRNEITNFQQRFDESFNQHSLNSAAGGNFLDKIPHECLGIIESKSKVRYSCNRPVVAKVSTTASTSGISPDVAELKDMEDFSAYVKSNDAVMRNMQTQGQNMQNQLTNLTDLITKFVNSNTAFTSSLGTLPSNTIANPRSDLKAITTRSVDPTNNGNTKDIQPQAVHPKPVSSPIFEPVITPVSASRPNPKASIPYPSRRNDERKRERAKD
nr:reverse transcriptase domain-containing protein [Tanacetum cinerariifolium]